MWSTGIIGAVVVAAAMGQGMAAGDAVVVKRVVREPAGVSLLRNGDLELVERAARASDPHLTPLPGGERRFAHAQGWGLGYEVDGSVARRGRYSARCASDDEAQERGIAFIAQLNQERPVPIGAQCWSKARHVSGAADSGYSLYLDIIFTDGTPLWGQTHAFATGTHEWQRGVVTVMPPKPIREVRVYGLLRGHRGTVWFDDFALWQVQPQGRWSVFDGVLVEAGVAARMPRPRGDTAEGRCGTRGRLGQAHIHGGGVRLTLDQAGRVIGEGRAGGFLLRDAAADSDFRQPLGRLNRSARGAHFYGEDRDLGLALEADYEGRADHVRVRGVVRDLTGGERAVTVYFTVPLEARGWRWADDLRQDKGIGAGGDYQTTVEVAGGMGRMARWPFAAVYPATASGAALDEGGQGHARATVAPPADRQEIGAAPPPSPGLSLPGRGVAIGYPLDVPRIYRVGYNAASQELYAAVDLGLSGETARFPHEASFEFLLYTFDAEWGMRAALKRYYETFPQYFVKRVEREGGWMPFTDIATVEGWQDFGFAFKEGTNNVAFDSAHGIYSFTYVEPVSYWMPMPKEMPRTAEAAQALLREKAQEAPNASYAAATYTSIVHDANGQPVMHLLRAPWCDGALFILNPAPGVPLTPEHGINKAGVMFAEIERAMSAAMWPLAEWRGWDRGYVVEAGAGPEGETALRCENAPGESSGASQTVILSPPRQVPLIARAWSKAQQVTGEPDADYSLYLDLLYADGTPGYAFVAPFAVGTHEWQQAQVRIDPPKPVAQVQFHLLLRAPHVGRAWFARPELRIGGEGETSAPAASAAGPPSPDLPSEGRGDGRDNLLANPGFAWDRAQQPAVSGVYIDSLEMGCEYLNYRREHWRDLQVPLVFDRASGRCAQALIFGTYEFVAECARRMHEQGRLMFANGALWRYIQFAPHLDVMGTETNWLADGELRLESDPVMLLRRALCYHKPYCLLMNCDYNQFPREYTERYFRHCLFYGIFPGFFSHNASDDPYWARPTLYNRDRELFRRYMPLIQQIARAGWEPLTAARSADAQVWVERFGPREGAVYFTIRNAGPAPKQASVTVDLTALGMRDASAVELLSGSAVSLQAGNAGSAALMLDLEPEQVALVRLTGEQAEVRQR